jgi:hemoglobin/transferrin/lactoferrin receptor protein
MNLASHHNLIKWAMSILAHLIIITTHGQVVQDSLESKELTEVVISGSKFLEKKKNIVQKIENISAAYISKVNAQNTGDLLMSTGNVFVQKSQQGGGSPVIRGFEASRILLIVDGIRMNNAIYRSGHLQNVITVDQNMLENIELLKGPASTLYGSDALGGAVHMMTIKPALAIDSTKTIYSGNAFARYSTVNHENTVHADINIARKRIGFLTSISLSKFNDLRMGRNDMPEFPLFGTRPFYIRPYVGISGDSIMKNSNDRLQKYSGYDQLDLMQKAVYRSGKHTEHLINFQLSTSSDAPRYDRLQDVRNGNLRFAEWYYGPQNRKLIAYTVEAKELIGFFGEYKATASYQSIEESRITREYKKYDQLDRRQEHISVIGLTIDARRKMKRDEITSGIDFQFNDVSSEAKRTNIITGTTSKLDTRYPDGKNLMHHGAVYIQHIKKMHNAKLILNDGIRYQLVSLHSTILDNSFFSLPVTDIAQRNGAITGNIGLAYMPTEKTRITIGYSSGFRAPNIDDLSKIFESSTAARQVVVPNPQIRPETTHSIDVGIKQLITSSMIIEFEGFYTRFQNAIIKAPFTLNGQDSTLYYNNRSQVLANQNIGRANLYGANASLQINLHKHWKFTGTANYTVGHMNTDNTRKTSVYKRQTDGTYRTVQEFVKTKPLDHIPPFFGKLSIAYQKAGSYAELFLHFNGWKKLDRYNADGEDNAQYATHLGTPPWQTLNFRCGFKLSRALQLQASLENILDLNYRYFASGLSAPGRNVSLTIRSKF